MSGPRTWRRLLLAQLSQFGGLPCPNCHCVLDPFTGDEAHNGFGSAQRQNHVFAFDVEPAAQAGSTSPGERNKLGHDSFHDNAVMTELRIL